MTIFIQKNQDLTRYYELGFVPTKVTKITFWDNSIIYKRGWNKPIEANSAFQTEGYRVVCNREIYNLINKVK